MKQTFWAGGVLIASLFVVRLGHATDGWIQIPGSATQIAVAANDIPFVLDTNGYAQYLAPSKRVCSKTLCVQSERQWTWTNTRASVIAVDQYGYLWRTDSVGGLGSMLPAIKAFDPTVTSMNVAASITSLAPGRMQWPYSEWKVPFGVAAGVHQWNSLNEVPGSIPATTTYATGVSSLSSIDLVYHPQVTFNSGNFAWAVTYTSNGWQPLDTGELQVTQFAVDGSATQIPWIIALNSAGRRAAFSVPSAGNFHYVATPKVFGLEIDIDWMTDRYVAASRSALSAVWRWTGNAYGDGGSWSTLPNSSSPSGGKIVQVAYASALPGTRVGTIGPSHLYMIDSYNNIYQWGALEGPVK